LGEVGNLHFGESLVDQATTISKEICVPSTTAAAKNYFLHARKIGNVLCALRPNQYMGTRVLRIHALLQAVVVCAFAAFGISSTATADTLGSVLAWGRNSEGQCNILASANSGVSAIAGGKYHTIALKDGAVLAWGDNNYGQCTIPASANSGVSAIAGGENHTIALKNGAVLAWGENWGGQCSIPASANSGVSAIAGGYQHTVALKGGAVIAWGYNSYGQCDIPTDAQSGVSAIAGGYYHTIALKNGGVLAWGDHRYGQCTIPASANSGVTAIAGGYYHTIALKGGEVLAWGAGTTNTGRVPNFGQSIIYNARSGVTAIEGGLMHTIALKGGAVIAWGYNEYGQCNIPTEAQSSVASIAGAYYHTIALKDWLTPTIAGVSPSNGTTFGGTSITITGTDFIGASSVTVGGVAVASFNVVSSTSITAVTQSGIAGAQNVAVTTPGGSATLQNAFTFVTPPTITSISPTTGTTLGGSAITITGTNFSADSTVTVDGVAATSIVVLSPTSISAVTPAGIEGARDVVVTIAGGRATKASAFTYIGLPGSGTVLAWGYNYWGQCNIPDSALSGVTAIAGGEGSSIALKDGCVLAWGYNAQGQCRGTYSNGNPITSDIADGTVLVQINGVTLTGVSAIAGGGEHTIALKGGAVFAWGDNSWGQCTIPNSALSGVSAIAGGQISSIALKGGAVLAWGYNGSGACNIPASAQSGVIAIAGGGEHTIALQYGGAVLAWGYNGSGECNIPDSAKSGVTAIAGGNYHTIALKGGAVLAWGNNDYGQCNIPASANSGVTAIAGGQVHTIALKGGAVLAWGYNSTDQCTIPTAAQSGVSAIAGGGVHTIALKGLDIDLTATQGLFANKVRLSWSAYLDATAYHIFRNGIQIGTTTGNSATQFDDVGATANSPNAYSVKVVIGSFVSGLSSEVSGFLLPPPSGVFATYGTSSTRVTVTWQSVANATGYQLFRSGTAAAIASVGAVLTYTDTPPVAGVEYIYTIKAVGQGGVSVASSGSTGYSSNGAAPQNVGATDGSLSSGVSVSWSAVTNATGYQVFRAYESGVPVRIGTVGAVLLFNDVSAEYGVVYKYSVRAVTAAGFSALSTEDNGYRGDGFQFGVIENFDSGVLSTADWTNKASQSALSVDPSSGRLQFSCYENLSLSTTAFNVARISSTWALGTTSNFQIGMDINFSPQDGSTAMSKTGIMAFFSSVDAVQGSNVIEDGFGLAYGSSVSGGYNYRTIAVVKFVGGVQTIIQSFYNKNGDDRFYRSDNNAYAFWMGNSATVYCTYITATSTLTVSSFSNDSSPLLKVVVPNAGLSTKRPLRLSVGGYALGRTTYLPGDHAWMDNLVLTQGKRSFKPTNFTASDSTTNAGVKLEWTAAPNATGYKIFRSGTTAAIATVGPLNNYLDTTAVMGTTYTYCVRALSTAGESESSNSNTGRRILVAAPTITTVSPSSGPLAAGTAFTITGANLTGATSVKVNGVAATSVVVVSATSITAKTPTGTAGAKSVAVTTVGGTATKASAFTYVAAPTITIVSPASGPLAAGTAFIITGTNLTGATSVKVNGVAATSVVVASATSIMAKTPAGTVGAKSVAVTTVGGTATKASAFTYIAAPTIASISPPSGTTAGGTVITITGTNLTGASSVKVNGVAATSVKVMSATSITAKTPSGTAGAKSVTVTTVGGTATKTSGFTYTASFAGDAIAGGNNSGGGVFAGRMNKPNDTSAGQFATSAAEEAVALAPMGIQLYLQTIITQPDADVDCVNTQSSDAPDATTGTMAAIDLDHNGEADICQLRRGDLDLNGVIDDRDMSILLHMIGTEPLHGIGDLDGNGEIDSADISLILLQMN